MTFDAILARVLELLQYQGRVSYRALQLRFNLDDDYLEALKDEIIKAQRLAVDEDSTVLVWTGQSPPPAAAQPEEQPATQDARVARAAPPETERGALGAERRQLTVMFCDLVGSTTLSVQLDPEDLRLVVRAYQETCAEAIERFEGHIAQYLGDGLLVYFGYPQAHEDDAQRAVRAGLGILEAMRTLNARLEQHQGIRLAVRVGIHTGLVVVGELGGRRSEQLALGETPNVAARLQDLAVPDTVVISTATYRLIQGFFACQVLGAHSLKGLAQPLAVYRVLQESGAQSRLEAAKATGLTPLVGREAEVRLLLERWAQVKEGMGQVVVLSSEAGLGKSRLVQVLKERLAEESYTRLECRCSPYHQHSAMYPVIDLMQRALRFEREDAPAEKLHKLEAVLSQYRLAMAETVPLFAALLTIPLPEGHYLPLAHTPQRQKQKTLESLLALMLELTAQQPMLLIVEDLHWIDPSTLELLALLIDQGPMARILTLFTCRPTFRPPWAPRSHLTQITLSRLSRNQVEHMIKQIVGGKALPAEVLQQLVTKTDGIPLFVEELTKMVLESGLLQEEEDHYELTDPLPPLAIPSTLQDSLMARLDRLGMAKTVAQLGATLGRTFSYELLQAVSPLDEVALRSALTQLVDAELLYQRGVPPQATYLFKHALIQEAAYQSLLKSTRQQYHQRTAQALATRFPEIAETQPELLAHHYTEAGLSARALDYWQRAGQHALQRSAHAEASAHLTKGLEVLATLPDTPERTQRDLTLHITLGASLMATKGFAAPDVERVYNRARALCQQVGEGPQLSPVLRGLWTFYVVRAELQTARELGTQLLSLAQRTQDVSFLLWAHYALGMTLLNLGEVSAAWIHLEHGLALYDPQKRQSHRALVDPGVGCLSTAAWAVWVLGYPDRAQQRSQEVLALARELAHPFSLVWTLVYTAVFHQRRREVPAAQALVEAAITLAREQGFTLWLAAGTMLQGWLLTTEGQGTEGLVQMRQSLAAIRTTGSELWRPYFLALLAEAHGTLGQVEEGLARLAEALALVDTTGERFYEAELYRLKGELLLRQAGADEGQTETCFLQALEVARRQQAKMWELRAAMSLSRLWRAQGRRDAAHQLLAEIYGWFTEGFDTADLREARALLEA